jgi:hypothetical protein
MFSLLDKKNVDLIEWCSSIYLLKVDNNELSSIRSMLYMGVLSALHFIPNYWTVPYRAATKSRMVPSQYRVACFQRSYHYPNFIKASIAFWTDHQSAPIDTPETEGQNKTNTNFKLLNNRLIKQKCEEKPQLSRPLHSTTSSPVLWDNMATYNKFSVPQNATNLNF